MHTHTHTYTHTHTHTHVKNLVGPHTVLTCTRLWTLVYVHVYANVHACAHVCILLPINTHTYAHTWTCAESHASTQDTYTPRRTPIHRRTHQQQGHMLGIEGVHKSVGASNFQISVGKTLCLSSAFRQERSLTSNYSETAIRGFFRVQKRPVSDPPCRFGTSWNSHEFFPTVGKRDPSSLATTVASMIHEDDVASSLATTATSHKRDHLMFWGVDEM